MKRDLTLLWVAVLAAMFVLLAHASVRVRAEAKTPAPTGTASPAAEKASAPAPAASPAPAAPSDKAEYVGREACEGCHTDYGKMFDLTDHAKAPGGKPDAANQCESCHGPGSEHVNAGGGPTGIVNPGKLQGLRSAAVCTRCHESKPGQYAWRFSKHANGAVACKDCHIAHPKSKQDVAPHMLRKGGEPDICYTCHAEVKAEVNWPSHHPVAEERLRCTDCHNPHGSDLTAYRQAPNSRELCLRCHAQYRGPFAREHQPVSEDCMQCHKPHGSFENRLLVASEPFLCLRCHGTVHNPHVPMAGSTPAQAAGQALYFSRCTVCHAEVHGSETDPRFTH